MARGSWRYLHRHPYYLHIQPFVEFVVNDGLDDVLHAHTSLASLVVSTRHRWDAHGPRVVVRPTAKGFYLEGFDPETGDQMEQRVTSVAEALLVFARLLRYLVNQTSTSG